MDFADFLDDLEKLAKKYTSELGIKIEGNQEDQIFDVFTNRITSLERAKHNMNRLTEFTQTATEHHPFWAMLEGSTEITSTLLDRWNTDLTKSDIDEIKWHLKTMQRSLDRVKV